MSKLVIHGGQRLSGDIDVYGAKNAVLPILAACVMTDEPVVLRGCPKLSDVGYMIEILERLGVRVRVEEDQIHVCAREADGYEMPEDLSKKMRSSIFLLGALISRHQKASVTQPGGCEIGLRPIDLHLDGLRKMNVQVTEAHGAIHCAGERARGGSIHLDYPSVGATENIMMAGVKAQGVTIIHNAAREPEVVDLARFINAMGGKVYGAGTDCITVIGVDVLRGTDYRIMPDRIVAGTYLTAAAITGSEVTINNIIPSHLRLCAAKLEEAGCEIDFFPQSVHIKAPWRLGHINKIETLPYPGFATDLQAQMMAVASVCEGTCIIAENVFENRFKHATELCRMGADIMVKNRIAIVCGVEELDGAQVFAHDLRGGAALVLAGLRARGQTVINDVHFIDRGYEDLAGELRVIGADITRGD